MKFKTLILAMFLPALFFQACTERIEIELDDSYIRLVVDGSITTDTMAHTVLLSTTSSYFYNKPSPAVTGAQVSITDGTQTFVLTEFAPGVYKTQPDVFAVPGKTYTLDVKLASGVGGYTEYKAESKLFAITDLDSVGLLFHPEWASVGIWEVKCYVQEPPTVDFYRFLIKRNNQLLTDTINEWFITDDVFFNGNYTNGATVAYLLQSRSDEGLRAGDTVTVEVNSVGKEYYNFLLEAQTELRGSNPLFSGPPANIKGNINNGGFGYFSAYSATRSYTITPEF